MLLCRIFLITSLYFFKKRLKNDVLKYENILTHMNHNVKRKYQNSFRKYSVQNINLVVFDLLAE